ncbi:unnamed protein product [Euphydryas editha]|uniref:Uncharacterized protein n=1 Tax=Euphydryas editha TaxID=104508 RepID=A0AAU9U1M3_EUPED|nr:unnamed protein product [Euphydryas editha]
MFILFLFSGIRARYDRDHPPPTGAPCGRRAGGVPCSGCSCSREEVDQRLASCWPWRCRPCRGCAPTSARRHRAGRRSMWGVAPALRPARTRPRPPAPARPRAIDSRRGRASPALPASGRRRLGRADIIDQRRAPPASVDYGPRM